MMDGVFGGLEATGLALSGSITSVDGSSKFGQLLIGHGTNGDFAGTLTAGEGIDVTNLMVQSQLQVKMQLQPIKV